MSDPRRVEFHVAPQIRHEDVVAPGSDTPTHRRIDLYDAFHDVDANAPMLSLIVPHESLAHEAFTPPTTKTMKLREDA